MEINTPKGGHWVLSNNVLEEVERFNYLETEVFNQGVGGTVQRNINRHKTGKNYGHDNQCRKQRNEKV